MSETVKTILAVTILTAALWVWADLEQPAEPEEVVPVRIKMPTEDYVVRSIVPEQVTVKLKGPRGAIQELRASPEDMACKFDLTESELREPRCVLHARDGFRHWAARRIFVTDVKSEHDGVVDGDVIVRVDRMIRVKVRVEPKVTGAVATVATVQPAEVMARVSESAWKGLAESNRYASAPLAVSSIPANPQIEREVPLDRKLGGPGGIEATFDPPIVKVTARLESALVTKSLGRFPILLSAPPDMLSRWKVVFQSGAENYVELEVQGPGPDIERLLPQEIRVELVLTAADKPDPASWLPGKLVVAGLPPGVKLTKPLPTVNFNLEKQSSDKPPAP
ncbi:MAG: CdaR family protein [Planctomycetota bacterium]|nr:CdaR family protein [Planctomycetota bacterium]